MPWPVARTPPRPLELPRPARHYLADSQAAGGFALGPFAAVGGPCAVLQTFPLVCVPVCQLLTKSRLCESLPHKPAGCPQLHRKEKILLYENYLATPEVLEGSIK